MKTKITKLVLMAIVGAFTAQTGLAQTEMPKKRAESGKNLLKVNLPSFALRTIAVQYERAIAKNISLGLGYRSMSKGALPFASSLNEIDEQLGSLQLGNHAFTPEIKFYMGQGVFRGFYIAPFMRIAKYNAAIDYGFEVNNTLQKIPLSGELKTVTGGLLLGAQWRVARKVYLDWSIIGPQYGKANGKLRGEKALNAQEQQELREELNGIDLPVVKITSTVDANGATVDFKGPWAGVRANIGIGYRF